MTDDNDLRLNTLHRFAKHSENLILEEHGHCEVPAGCGGVIITWRNPELALPLILHVASPGRCRVSVDGTLLRSGRLELVFGTRELVFHISEIADGPRAFAAVARVDLRAGYDPGPLVPGSQTAADGSWLMARTDPAAHASQAGDPMESDADSDADSDALWQPMVTAAEATPIPDTHRWQFERAREHGAGMLALPADLDEVWLRKSFAVTRAMAGGEL